MERGYLKVWRKIEDSQSYNRSALHRAILLTIFVKANWKGGFFCGRTVAPGHIATSIKSLAEELREPRTNVMRALRDIEKDGVINLENVGNKWTMITLVNWNTYQAQDEKCGQPAVNQRSTSGQPVDTIKEGKKERRKEEDTPPVSPDGGECAGDGSPAGKKQRQPKPRFTVPTEDEVSEYCRERNNGISGQAFCDFYASRGWCIGKQPMRDWKAAVRTWENKRREELASRAHPNGTDDMEAAMERVRQRNERLKAAERGEVA